MIRAARCSTSATSTTAAPRRSSTTTYPGHMRHRNERTYVPNDLGRDRTAVPVGDWAPPRPPEVLLEGQSKASSVLRTRQAAGVDPALDAALPDVLDAAAEHALEEHEWRQAVLVRSRKMSVDVALELLQTESVEVIAQSLEAPAVSSRRQQCHKPSSGRFFGARAFTRRSSSNGGRRRCRQESFGPLACRLQSERSTT